MLTPEMPVRKQHPIAPECAGCLPDKLCFSPCFPPCREKVTRRYELPCGPQMGSSAPGLLHPQEVCLDIGSLERRLVVPLELESWLLSAAGWEPHSAQSRESLGKSVLGLSA